MQLKGKRNPGQNPLTLKCLIFCNFEFPATNYDDDVLIYNFKNIWTVWLDSHQKRYTEKSGSVLSWVFLV